MIQKNKNSIFLKRETKDNKTLDKIITFNSNIKDCKSNLEKINILMNSVRFIKSFIMNIPIIQTTKHLILIKKIQIIK